MDQQFIIYHFYKSFGCSSQKNLVLEKLFYMHCIIQLCKRNYTSYSQSAFTCIRTDHDICGFLFWFSKLYFEDHKAYLQVFWLVEFLKIQQLNSLLRVKVSLSLVNIIVKSYFHLIFYFQLKLNILSLLHTFKNKYCTTLKLQARGLDWNWRAAPTLQNSESWSKIYSWPYFHSSDHSFVYIKCYAFTKCTIQWCFTGCSLLFKTI